MQILFIYTYVWINSICMEKVVLKNIELNNEKHEVIYVFLYPDQSLVLLPTLFLYSVVNEGGYSVINKITDDDGFKQSRFEFQSVAPDTINTIAQKLISYLTWVETYSLDHQHISVFTHHNFPEDIINYYVNEVLVKERQLGENSVSQSVMALNAYYLWLCEVGLTTEIRARVKPKNKDLAKSQNKKKTAIQYLTCRLRSEYYRECESLQQECILRAGGELGIRTCENRGFLLDDYYYGKVKRKGLKSLFDELQANPNQQTFEYYLCGHYTKAKPGQGGESRTLYFSRDLLELFEKYSDAERPESESNSFFLTNSKAYFGKAIGPKQGTNVFKIIRDKLVKKQEAGLIEEGIQLIESEQSYHFLRHSFGTDKFHELTIEKGISIDDVTTYSAVMLEVAKLLGHSLKGKNGPETTRRYIRLAHEKASLEF